MTDVARVVAIVLFFLVAIGTSLYPAIWATRRLHLSAVTSTGSGSALITFLLRTFVFFIVFSVVFAAWGPVLFLLNAIFD